MVTVSEDLIREGAELLSGRNAEDIHKLGDRIISVEPDNWYGLYVRGCAYAFEADFANCLENWGKFVENLDDDSFMEKCCDEMAGCLVHCLTHVSGKPKLDFGKFGQMLITINDKLPESEDEVLVTTVMKMALDYLKDNAAVESILTYYSFKAMVFSSFRAYVELPLISGFFDMLMKIGDELKLRADAVTAKGIETDRMFLEEVKAAMDAGVAACPPETLEKVEEYWLCHKTETYVGHIQQAYNFSAAYITAGKLTGKILKKSMLAEVQLTFKMYFSASV